MVEPHEKWMHRACELARSGLGHVEPNPMVGCILVDRRDGVAEVIGTGHHRVFGGAHAEREAILDAVQRGFQDRLSHATAYVTLEPCCHHGKTPPCTEALIEARVRRVVVAMLDPFPEVAGKGVEQLREAGIEVQVGIGDAAARQLNAPYLKRVQMGRPWVTAKWAMSLDGKIATRTGDSQWISSPESRKVVHQLRGRMDAILVGSGTALADDPSLTARGNEPPLRSAIRVVFDSRARLPLESKLVKTAGEVPVLLWAGPETESSRVNALGNAGVEVVVCDQPSHEARLDRLLCHLVDRYAVTNLLAEGGGGLLGGLLQLKQIDALEVFIAPKLIGGKAATSPVAGLGIENLSQCGTAKQVAVERIGDDTLIRCCMHYQA